MTTFDDFFNNITNKNSKKINFFDIENFEKQLKKIDENIKNASDINDFLNKNFDTPEVKITWENAKKEDFWTTKSEEKITKNTSEEKGLEIEIKYPKNKDSANYGFAWVAGMKELKEELIEHFIKPLKFKFMVQKITTSLWEEKNTKENSQKEEMYKMLSEAFEKFKVGIPTGMLFYWPPGTWKTFLTKKLAEELDAWMIEKSVWEFGSSYIHETSKNIKKFFDAAKKASENWPIILFLDEIDSLLSKRTGQIDQNKAEEISQFLQEFNALEEEAPNLIVIAATNRPDHLDSAILRSGRLDKKIYLWPPDFEARKELFHIYLEKNGRPSKDLDFDKLALLTESFVSADIEHICDEVSRSASKNILDLVSKIDNNLNISEIKNTIKNSMITMELLEKEIAETTSSLKYTDMSVYKNWLQEKS